MARAIKNPPQGLAFLERIAELVCSEYEFSYNWKQEGDSYVLQAQCGQKQLTFHFDRESLDDPGSDEYRTIAEKMLETLLTEFKPSRAAVQ